MTARLCGESTTPCHMTNSRRQGWMDFRSPIGVGDKLRGKDGFRGNDGNDASQPREMKRPWSRQNDCKIGKASLQIIPGLSKSGRRVVRQANHERFPWFP